MRDRGSLAEGAKYCKSVHAMKQCVKSHELECVRRVSHTGVGQSVLRPAKLLPSIREPSRRWLAQFVKLSEDWGTKHRE
jgi:hypothetical protein